MTFSFSSSTWSRTGLVAVLVAQVAACATTHQFAPSAMPSVARVAGPPPRPVASTPLASSTASLTFVRDREGNMIPFRPGTPMVLHLAWGSRRQDVTTRPRELHVQADGLWLRDAFIPATQVAGFEAVDPHRGESLAVIAVGAALGALLAVTLLVYAIAPKCDC